MTTITNLAAVVASIVVTHYSTNIVSSDNAVRQSWREPTFTLIGWNGEGTDPNSREVTAIMKLATERYEQITIKEHKTAEVTLTNGVVLRQELTNRVVSDRIRTWKLIQTEEFVGEKDVPQLVFTNILTLRHITLTNAVLWQIDDSGTNITIKEKP